MASTAQIPVFTETNLGTHVAMAVPLDITAADFKRELERMHFSCFPKLGEIKVQKLMVKRRLCLYHLPESIPIKHVFQGCKRTWFLHIEARPLNGLSKLSLSNEAASIRENSYLPDYIVTDHKKNDVTSNVINPAPEGHLQYTSHPKKRKSRRKIESKFFDFGDEGSENGCVATQEKIPRANTKERLRKKLEQPKVKRTDISNSQADLLPHFAVRTPTKESPFISPTYPRPGSSKFKYERSEVGKRVIVASNELRLSAKKKNLATPVFRYGYRKPLGCNISSITKYLVFEMEDCEDDD